MLCILACALMVSLNTEMQGKHLQPKQYEKTALQTSTRLGVRGQGPTNTELSNKISCTKTNDRPVMTKSKDKY